MVEKCMVIAEIGQAHDGSLGTAHAYIDAVAKSGADAIKFQTHIPEEESTPGEPWRVKFSYQDETRFDYWKRVSFTGAQWKGLADHAKEKGLVFFSSPFSIAAVDLLESLDVPFYKLGAGELTNQPLIEKIAKTGKHLFLSTGMGSWAEMDMAVAWIEACKGKYTIMQCTSQYPCAPESIGINLINEIKTRYNCPVGLSDHSGSIFPGLAAASLGASIVEVHVTFSKDAFGPDVSSSLTLEELKTLVKGVEFIHKMLSHPIDKDHMSSELTGMKQLFYKSMVATRAIEVGEVLTDEMIAFKKPGTGIPTYHKDKFIGKRVVRGVEKDKLFCADDFDKESL